MNHLFQVTVYTGQQLVLEALQRWLQRPCAEPDGQRHRRASIKSLIILLLKTAATGVLATILDAAIEYRRRQLLAAAAEEPNSSAQSASYFGGFSTLSRAGIAAWKAKLIIAIDEMERQAHQYGIEPSRRFAPVATLANSEKVQIPEGKLESATAAAAAAVDAVGDNLDDRQAALAATVEQLQQLAKLGGEDSERCFEDRVDSLLDTLLGCNSADNDTSTPSLYPHSRNNSIIKGGAGALKTSTSTSRLFVQNQNFNNNNSTTIEEALASPTSTASHEYTCHICMDRAVGVQVVGCQHHLCFQCARTLCATQDHSLPQCPFCRQPINGFSSFTLPTTTFTA